MKYAVAFFSLLLFASIAYSQRTSFYVSGTTNRDYVGYVTLRVGDKTYRSYLENKKFEFKGRADLPIVATLKIERGSCETEILIDSSVVTATIDLFLQNLSAPPCLSLTSASGGNLQYMFGELTTRLPHRIKQFKSYDECNEALFKHFDACLRFFPHFGFIAESIFREKQYLTIESLSALVKKFTDAQKKTVYYAYLLGAIEQKEKTIPGAVVENFRQTNIGGKQFELSSLKGKYVLIDFWASWCKPCRDENPNLKKMYERYRGAGLEIVSVSLDTDESLWKKAVINDELQWIHTSDLKGWKNEVAKQFQVTSIPYNILIDPEGKILSSNLRGSALEATLRQTFSR
jgi:thiol-disulfide isomerase/thioredoxin